MKAIVYEAYGYTDVLTLKTLEIPRPKNDEVLVKVRAASVNSWDWDLVRGKPFLTRLPGGGIRKPIYNILGADISGEVVAIGKDVKEFQLGDEVFGDISGCGWGGFAEYVCAREDALTRKSYSMTFEQAASIPQAAVLALQGLRNVGNIKAGQEVLINGAGGGVGTFAIQLAKLFGTTVTGVDSTSKKELMASIGADEVIDYTQTNFTETGQQFDLIVDVVGKRSMGEIKRALRPNGTYVMIGGQTSRILQAAISGLLPTRSSKKMRVLVYKPSRFDQETIRDIIDADHITPILDKIFSLDETPEAIQYLGEGHAKGKVIIRMEPTFEPNIM